MTTTTTPRPLCQATKLPLPTWDSYRKHTVEIVERQVETAYDGTTTVHVLKAGTFCCSACAASWLLGASIELARKGDGVGGVPPCVVFAADEGDPL